MKIIPSSTGGTITPIIENGVQVGIRHTAGKAYSGKMAAIEAKAAKAKKSK
jgi:hypothetical protein